MRSELIWISVVQVLILTTSVNADDNEISAGEKLYGSQCMVCHGRVALVQTDLGVPTRTPHHLANLEAPHFGAPVAQDTAQGIRITMAPPFGPNLRGILGRLAGNVAGFDYSESFLKALRGMEWTEAALDVWITNTQRWVPGVFMYYKQPDPEIRRKIILYLKANP